MRGILFMIYYIFQFIYELSLPGSLIDGVFYARRPDQPQDETLMLAVGYYGLLISYEVKYTLFFFAFERILKRTKYIITLLNIILVLLYIYSLISPVISNLNLPFSINDILLIFNTIMIIAMLYYITKWTRQEFKITSLIIITGFILVDIGMELMSIVVKSYNIFPLYVSSIIQVIGILISTSPAFLDPKYYVKKQKFWKILSVLVIIAYFIILFPVYLIIGVASFFVYTIIMSIATYILTVYFIINNINSAATSRRWGGFNRDGPDLSNMFKRPEQISVEEIADSKEKKICLVCKSKVSRVSYICPECDNYYCEKCSSTLTDLENACWVCNTPFDESKPVSLTEEKMKEDIIVEDNIKAESKKSKKKNK